jgi:hypothetical protein
LPGGSVGDTHWSGDKNCTDWDYSHAEQVKYDRGDREWWY